MNIQEKIEQAIEDGPGSETTLDDETLHEIARRWLADARHRRERDTQKRAERTTFKDRPEVRRVMSEGIFELTLRMTERFANEYTEEFLASRFIIEEGGETVGVLQATMSQHVRRAAFLEDLAAGNAATAVLHRRIVADLRDSGADTLEEMLRGRG